ncbi:MAG TPA: IS1380 family transposase [Actinomycetes bacterium]|nr:IS1380 family transposase [Actinomycetes bacterium]
MGSSRTLDQLDTCFDDIHAIANAGLLLPATLAERLGIEQAADALIDLGERPGAAHPGRKLLTLVHSMLAGGDCIDDADLLRCGQTASVLGHRAMAPSTLGTFLRAFTFGHVRQLDRLTEQLLTRAWAAGVGPGDGPMTIDLDSTVCPVHGYHKQGAAYGHTHTLGYHPLLATRADTGEVLHARQRTGRANTARGAARFVDELAARVRRAGATGELTMRMDSGFWSAKTIRACRRHGIHYSITVRQTKPIRPAIATISEQTWVEIAYPDGGLAQVAETRYRGDRLIVRRTRLIGAQAELFPNWRYHALVTDRVGTTVWLDQDHRRHATVELCIRDLKAGVGLRHCPSGKFSANAAWLLTATLAHTLLRWIAAIGLGARDQLVVAKTLRRTLLSLPGRLTRSARRCRLRLPASWPWAAWFELALARLRCVAYAT